MIGLFCILTNAFGDRLRGGLWHKPLGISNTLYGSFIFTGCMVLLLGLSPLESSVVLLASLLGSAPGWGEPLGSYLRGQPQRKAKLEWWQKDYLELSSKTSLLVRGFMWGLPISLVLIVFGYSLAGVTVLLAYTFAMLAAPALAKERRSLKGVQGDWEMQEWIRGALVMTALVTLV